MTCEAANQKMMVDNARSSPPTFARLPLFMITLPLELPTHPAEPRAQRLTSKCPRAFLRTNRVVLQDPARVTATTLSCPTVTQNGCTRNPSLAALRLSKHFLIFVSIKQHVTSSYSKVLKPTETSRFVCSINIYNCHIIKSY